MTRVGIPRALLYYQYFPMWRAFFEYLGAEAVLSPATTQAMLTAGSSRVVADTCLPVKAFCGHVLALARECDYIFIPVVRSVRRRTFNCSKFLGLPDMTRAVIPESPIILDIEIDINQGRRALYEAIYRLGRLFSWNPLRVRRAALAAWQAHQRYRNLMSSYSLTAPQAISGLTDGAEAGPRSSADSRPTVAVIGHPYLLYDDHISHRLVQRLERAGYRVLTPEMVPDAQLEGAIARVVGAPYWTYEAEVVGAGGHYLTGNAQGVIGVTAFGCGPDSLMMDMLHRLSLRLGSIPFMSLTLEEHTAEAGVVTRLEAFLDMIQRRRKKEHELCV